VPFMIQEPRVGPTQVNNQPQVGHHSRHVPNINLANQHATNATFHCHVSCLYLRLAS
jgi:hypothetical protein